MTKLLNMSYIEYVASKVSTFLHFLPTTIVAQTHFVSGIFGCFPPFPVFIKFLTELRYSC